MRSRVLLLPLLAVAARSVSTVAQVAPVPTSTLPAFQSDSELSSYLRAITGIVPIYEPAVSSCGGNAVSKSTASKPVATSTSAGTIVVHGSVKDLAGNPLAGTSIDVAGRSTAAQSSASGTYRVSLPAVASASESTVVVRARRIGFHPRQHAVKLRVGDSVRVDFSLCAAVTQLEQVVVSGAAAAALTITNAQHAGVDEGGIVKLYGDYLVVLRRGRLFTVALDDDELRPISAVNAYAPGVEARGDWYDELLLFGDKVVVVGYSYRRGGTEIGIFRIDRRGSLHYQATYHLRSDDYYSSRNYASRLVGGKLVFYTPLYVRRTRDPLDALPSMRKWVPEGPEQRFKRIVTPQRVYRPARPLSSPHAALHTVTSCDLAAIELTCQATVLVGPWGRVFYVSPSSVYVWVTEGRSREKLAAAATLYRMPLDGSEPTALGVAGAPVDQFSFLESEDGHLNVVVRSDAGGDAMWRGERSAGGTALLRASLASFGDGTDVAPWYWYRQLPAPVGSTFHNRFVGEHLLYGTGNSWGDPLQRSADLHVVSWKGGDVHRIALPHGADRIEPMGSDAVVIGSDGRGLHFSGIRLEREPRLAQRFVLDDAAQGELRSHGFFYTPTSPTSGTLGLPVRYRGKRGSLHLVRNSASILYLRNDDEEFDELGELRSIGENASDDGCVASCVDWYGNARPLFIGRRIFALLGYELVEGRVAGSRMREVRRVNYAMPRFMPVNR